MAQRTRVQKAEDRLQRARWARGHAVTNEEIRIATAGLTRAQERLAREQALQVARSEAGTRKAAAKQAAAKRHCPDNHPRRRPWHCYCTFGPPSCNACSITSECVVCGDLLTLPPTPGEKER